MTHPDTTVVLIGGFVHGGRLVGDLIAVTAFCGSLLAIVWQVVRRAFAKVGEEVSP